MQRPKILFVNPYIYDFAAYDLWIKPLGLLYLASLLEEQGCEIRLLDAMDRYDPDVLKLQNRREPKSKVYGDGFFHKEIVEKPAIFKSIPRNYSRYGMTPEIFRSRLSILRDKFFIPDAVLVTSGMTYWYKGVHEAIGLVKEFFPSTTILLGGIYATLFTDFATKNSGADKVLRGEGEKFILNFLAERFGISVGKKYEGYDDYPRPAYHLYPRLDYVTMMTSRGCPYTCSFCATHEFTESFSRRQPQFVLDEILSYAQRGIKNISFYDDALFVNAEKHIKPILRGLIDSGVKINFHTPNGLFAKLIDSELAGLLMQSGFKTMRLSYETKNPERQKQMRKVNDDDLERALANLESAGFLRHEIVVYLMMGLPFQKPKEVFESMEYVQGLGARVSLSSFSPIPGTPEWEKAVRDFGFPTDDPLWTNKSVYPLKTESFCEADFDKLKMQAVNGNKQLLHSSEPISDYNVYA